MSPIRHMLTRSLLVLALPAVWGCSSSDTFITPPRDYDRNIPAHCNPLGGITCLSPWPSAAFLTPADTATGVRVSLPAEAMPINSDGEAVDPAPYNRYDGFAPSGVLIAHFPGGVSAEGLPPARDPAASLAPESPTVVINMDTGARLLHFAEVDMTAARPQDRALIIRPLERMQPGARYAVAIRSSVKDASGAPLTISPGFQEILESRVWAHPLMERLAPRYEAIFAALEAAGVERSELKLAWDFVTASDDFLTSDLMTMRSKAMPIIANGSRITAETIAVDPESHPERVYRAIAGTYEVPSFLTAGEIPGSVLVRGEDGTPELSGTYEANFSAIIPACVNTAPLPVPVLLFGHGLFDTAADSINVSLLQDTADQLCMVVVAGDFIGFTRRQLMAVLGSTRNLNLVSGTTEKLAQAIVNFLALSALARSSLAEHPLFQHEQRGAIIDTSRTYYLGASLGGIMGNVLMAYDPSITRGALGVPGGAWSLLFERSVAWGPLGSAAKSSYDDPAIYQIIVALLSMRFEPYDPITTAERVVHNPLPDTPAKQILAYQGVGDSVVSNLATEMIARTLGIDVTGPSVYVPYGLSESTEPKMSGFTIYDENPATVPPETNVPLARDNGIHDGVHVRAAVMRQMERFFVGDGQISHPCLLNGTPAPCECSTGACD